MAKSNRTAISPTRDTDYNEWFQQVIKGADLAENAPVRGCMIIRPWGYALWEAVQKAMDRRFKETGHENAYFPLLIPLRFLEKEADHVEGFAKEMAVVTHHRLESKDGKLVPASPLEEPMVIRPTSETIIGEAFARWIRSYRDLPLKINQWANVMRWEMRPRLFLRTSEFLWQEGHTAHADEAEAREEVMTMLEVYREIVEEHMAIPVICGAKSAGERFPGAVDTYTIEAMMQDGKALQSGTSHYLGQNFAKAADIRYQDDKGDWEHCHTTSWGTSTRLIGGLIMTHSDDDGLRVPPRMAPEHVVIVPITRDDDQLPAVMEYANKVAAQLREVRFDDERTRVRIDDRKIQSSEKRWDWVRKGAPIILEVGPRDMEEGKAAFTRRDQVREKKQFLTIDEIAGSLEETLWGIQSVLFEQAKEYRSARTRDDITTRAAFEEYFAEMKGNTFNTPQGFVKAWWCESEESEASLKPLAVSVRCIPLDQSGGTGVCVLTGEPATRMAIFAKSY